MRAFAYGRSAPGGSFSLGESPPDFARQATSFHLLAQIKGGKAKCPNASDPTELHGWKENAVDDEHLGSIIGLVRQEDLRRRERFEATGPHFDATAELSCRSVGLEWLVLRHFALVTFICASKCSEGGSTHFAQQSYVDTKVTAGRARPAGCHAQRKPIRNTPAWACFLHT